MSAQKKSAPSQRPAVLVTGGAGYVGQTVVKTLSETANVISVYRNRLPETQRGVYPVCSDLSSPELLAAPLRGVTTAVHLAWEGTFASSPERSTSNLDAVRCVVAALEKSGVERLIFLSALGASPDAESAFLRSKYEAESIILNSQLPRKIILRSGVVFGGPSDRFLLALRRLMRFPVFYPVPRSKSKIAPIYIADLCQGIANLVTHPLEDEISLIELTGSEPYRMDELMGIIAAESSGTRIPLGWLLGSSFLSLIERYRSGEAPLIREFLDLRGDAATAIDVRNPLAGAIPKRLSSLREILGRKGQSPAAAGAGAASP